LTAFSIAGRTIGPDEPAYIIAEVGVNHDGSLEDALALVDVAAEAGADAVKFQTFDAAQLASQAAPLAEYQQAGSEAASQVEMLERLEFSEAEWDQVAARCAERGLTFLSTPFDAASAQTLGRLEVPAYKVGSGDLTNLPFLRSLAANGLPMIVSTGMATMPEIDSAVEAIADSGDPPLSLLHCISSYPTPPEQANLRAMDTLRAAFPHLVIGYSDHCLGLEVSFAAVARGAAVLERHITLDRDRPGPDHAISLEPDDLRALVAGVRMIEASLGTGEKTPAPAEQETRVVVRRSLVAADDLPAGHVLRDEDVLAKRPGGGLPPDAGGSLIGRPLRVAISRDEQFTADHVA
jgi:N-acetylneuraminate synthase